MTSGFDWAGVLNQLLDQDELSEQACHDAMAEIVAGRATPAQIAGFVVALRAKGETPPEVMGLVAAMLDVAVPLDHAGPALDIVGTGGDRSNSVNISTMAAIVAAGAGATVVKHGNRAASSTCGSADVLGELGVKIDLGPEGVLACIEEAGIGFCFAPVFHPALRHAGPPRRELGIPTVFNILGPLANPARPVASLVGSANPRMAPLMAQVFAGRGQRAMVVRGTDGLDEVTIGADTDVWDVTDGDLRVDVVSPAGAGVEAADARLLAGGDAAFNARIAHDLLGGQDGGSMAAVRTAVLLNTGLALVVWDAALGGNRFGPVGDSAADRLARAVPAAAESLDSGRARDVLERWVSVSAAHA
ncbi:MAG: anthranilate phosphoribosyltransferase [Actinobacteria bacterium]|nr:anthranilate phosphoribosyltransferase [Actinomycetota bacterium]